MKNILFWGFIVFLYLLPRSNFSIPITIEEAKESYTSYSIYKTGLDTNGKTPSFFFHTDNDYVSTLGVYLRIPIIAVSGLNNFTTRLPGILVGLVCLILLYILALKKFNNPAYANVSLILFVLSPLFLKTTFFSFGLTMLLLFFLLSLIFLSDKKRLPFYLCLIIFPFCQVEGVLLSLLILIYDFYLLKIRKIYRIPGILVLLAGFIFLITGNTISDYFYRHSIISAISPKSYTFEIEKRLSFGTYTDSKLIKNKINWNRVAHNKVYYGINEFFRSIVSPFNFELLTSSFQSGTILAGEAKTGNKFPAFYYWEVPLFIFGFIRILNLKNKDIYVFLVISLAMVIIFGSKFLILTIPIMYMPIGVSFVRFIKYLKVKNSERVKNRILPILRRTEVFIIFIFTIYAFSYFALFDLFYFHSNKWLLNSDLMQGKIWSSLSEDDFKTSRLFVTDRLGEPAFYYAYYKRINPREFIESQKGPVVASGIKRIDSIGKVKFGSFKYYEMPRSANEIWIGLVGEFVGENKDFKLVENVSGGTILDKFEGAEPVSKFIGGDVVIVKTN